jgi:hypothetical protein
MIAILACSLLLIALIAMIYLLNRALDDPKGRHAYGAPHPNKTDDPDEPAQFLGLIELPRREPVTAFRVPGYLTSPGDDDTVTDLLAVADA